MGKKKHRPGRKVGSVPRHVGDEFHAAERPMRGRRRMGADTVLEPFAPHRGDGADFLEALLDFYAETGNFRDMLETSERLIELRPNDPDLILALAGSQQPGPDLCAGRPARSGHRDESARARV